MIMIPHRLRMIHFSHMLGLALLPETHNWSLCEIKKSIRDAYLVSI